MKADNILGIFMKYPTPGMVKTRIAVAIGIEQAALFYKKLAESVLEQTMPEADEYRRIIFFEPAEKKPDFENWLGNESFITQQGNDIGERMAFAIKEILKIGKKAVIIGTDIPEIDANMIADALRMLDDVDIVLGPAKDGGYYLIGMKTLHPQIFKDITWSSAEVLSQTMEIINKLGLTCSLLPELSDIDTIEDYKRFKILHTSVFPA